MMIIYYDKLIKYIIKNQYINKNKIGGNHNNVFQTDINNINAIVNSWMCYNKKIMKVTKNMDKKQKYEFDNIIERFLISFVNFNDINNSKKQMELELDNKNIVIKNNFIDKLIKCFTVNNQQLYDITYNYKNNKFKIKIKMDSIKTSIILPQERFDFLVKKSNNNMEYIAYTILKYNLIGGMKGQNWSIPKEIYQQMIDLYDVSFECFASPFNSQLVLLRDDANYCSIFESDKIFGSYGSFFNAIDKNLLKGKNIVINPPFIEHILEETAKYAIKHDGIVVFFGPYWKDAKFIELLESANAYKQILKANKHYYTSYNGDNIMAKFDSVVFTLNLHNLNNLNNSNTITEQPNLIYKKN